MVDIKNLSQLPAISDTGFILGAESDDAAFPSLYSAAAVRAATVGPQAQNVVWYGAVPDAQFADGNITITTNTFSLSFSNAVFSAADVGKTIFIPGAGVAGATLITTIAGYTSPTTVTLADTAKTTVSAVAGRISWGTDNTTVIQNVCAASTDIYFPPGYYLVNIPDSYTVAFVTYTNKEGIWIRGENAWIVDGKTYSAELSTVFKFVTCKNINFMLNYTGIFTAYAGIALAYFSTSCADIYMKSRQYNGRYCLRAGDYSLQNEGYTTNIKADLETDGTMYAAACYLSSHVDFNIYSKNAHRHVYLAGVDGGRLFVRGEGHTAPVGCLLTDSKTGDGTSRGTTNVSVQYYNDGLATALGASYAAGISASRPDAVVYENINFNIYTKGNNSATPAAGFAVINSGVQWNSNTQIRNINFSGSIDRTGQTIDNPLREIYIPGLSTSQFKATIDNEAGGSGDILTITSQVSPVGSPNYFVAINAILTGGSVLAGTKIIEFLSGTRYGLGRYRVDKSQNLSETTLTATSTPTFENINLNNICYTPGSGANPAGYEGVNVFMPGLQTIASVNNCDFGPTVPFTWQTNLTSATEIKNSNILGTTNTSSGGTATEAYPTSLSVINSKIGKRINFKTDNKTVINSSIEGAGAFIKTKILNSGTLTGPFVKLTNAIPPGILLGINAVVTDIPKDGSAATQGVYIGHTTGNIAGSAANSTQASVSGSVVTLPITVNVSGSSTTIQPLLIPNYYNGRTITIGGTGYPILSSRVNDSGRIELTVSGTPTSGNQDFTINSDVFGRALFGSVSAANMSVGKTITPSNTQYILTSPLYLPSGQNIFISTQVNAFASGSISFAIHYIDFSAFTS